MIILDSPFKSLQISLTTSATTSQFQFVTSYADILATYAFLAGEQAGVTNNTTNVTVLNSPAVGAQRQLKFLSVFNADTATNTLSLYVFSGATSSTIGTFSLLPNQTFIYNQESGFNILSNQSIYVSGVSAVGYLYTGGTNLNPIINLASSPIFSSLNISGLTTSNSISATSLSSTTINVGTISATTYQNLPVFTTSTTGSTSISFGFENGHEDSYVTSAVTDSNVTSISQILFYVVVSTDHNELEDSFLDGVEFAAINLIPGVGFTLVGEALNNTWGTYNLIYKIIN